MMKLKTFAGGVHPYEGKELSAQSVIRSVEATDILAYPLSQHIGAPAKAVVSKGDFVLKGQLIAEAGGFISAPIHASVSGKVKAIEKRRVISGGESDCIVVENDGKYETAEGFSEERDGEKISADEIASIIKSAGIVGLGGAGFPTAVKLTPKNASDIDTLIINGCECEPYLTSDYRIMIEKADELILGIKAALKLFKKAKAVIAIENNKPDAIKLLSDKTETEEKISVRTMKTKYPQGGERQLIFAVTGRKINSKKLPADVGCIVMNISSCFAVYEAVYKNMPLIHKVITVTGDGVNSPCNLDVPLGISLAEALDAAGGAKEEVVKFICGGPMMGIAVPSLDVPIIKTSSAILAFTKDDVACLEPSACIHCGRCVSACPQKLVPQMLVKEVSAEQFEKFEALGGMECIECGCCAYVCPAKIPLTQVLRHGKFAVRSVSAKNKGGK